MSGCGIVADASSKSEDGEGDSIFVPRTLSASKARFIWDRMAQTAAFHLRSGTDVGAFGDALQNFLRDRYGETANFHVAQDYVLVAQMRQFLSLFSILLLAIGGTILLVGGIGLSNMLLVQIADRRREIGLARALGATVADIRGQILSETMIICGLAGIAGVLIGWGAFHGGLALLQRQ